MSSPDAQISGGDASKAARPAVIHGSIRRRLLVLLLAGSAVLAVLLYFVVLSVTRQVAQQSQDNVLAASAMSILSSARVVNGEITIDLPYSALSMLDSVTDERVFYAIRLGGEFLSGYGDLPRPEPGQRGETAFLSASYSGEGVRIASVARPISTDLGNAPLSVSVAQTLTGRNLAMARIARTALGVGAGFFALSALLALFVAQSTIRPLNRLTVSVSRRGPRDLRPVAAPVPSEMAPLVTSLNSFMKRLETSLARSEDFIAEAAHRVRTPLAIVRTQAEIVQRRVRDEQTRDAVREMIHAVDESSRTAGQLLDHAMVIYRLDDLAREIVDLPDLAAEAVARLGPLSEMRDIDLRLGRLDACAIRGDAILLQNALHNLLDNAIKYCPAEAEIIVSVRADADHAELRVSDTGPGFPEGDQARLLARFSRGSNVEGIAGSGLGLTIVQDVTQAHGGQVRIANQKQGGACVSLSFPRS